MVRAFLDHIDGCTVREASDGQIALDKLDHTVDVLVLDRDMPKVSGAEVVERIDETTYPGPIVILSNHAPDSALGRSDVTSYLPKEPDIETVVEELDAVYPE